MGHNENVVQNDLLTYDGIGVAQQTPQGGLKNAPKPFNTRFHRFLHDLNEPFLATTGSQQDLKKKGHQ